eukprot:358081-Chlamydomonas_euryale.AAC.4
MQPGMHAHMQQCGHAHMQQCMNARVRCRRDPPKTVAALQVDPPECQSTTRSGMTQGRKGGLRGGMTQGRQGGLRGGMTQGRQGGLSPELCANPCVPWHLT